jgi:beta-lactamase regulating signal transducer with metallopeptidase domain
MIAGLLDHLWQSTLFAGGAGLLTLWLRRHPARLRFRLWFAASLKFLVPFAVLSVLGQDLSRLFPASMPRLVLEIRPAAERLSAPARALAVQQHAGLDLVPLLAGIWLAGFAAVLGVRLVRWLRLRAVMRQARNLEVPAPVDVKASASLLEPGLVGIFRPVVLLPEGLMARLSRAERDAILAHELSHFCRGDNITAAIHMLVEALFWFWPPVWLIGARLIAERERACDENVLAEGHDAETYAGGILKVCRFCIQSPLACAAGASGADLGRRVRQIMSGETALDLGDGQRVLLRAAFAMALLLPVAEGFVAAPPLMVEVRRGVAAVKSRMAERMVQVAAAAQVAAAPAVAPKPRHAPRSRAAVPEPQPLAETALPPAPAQPQADNIAAAPPPALVPAVAAASSVTPAPPAAVRDVLVALYPRGNGDPDSITCRSPEVLPGSRLPGPKVCQTNREWASLRARREDIAPDGHNIILPDGSERRAGYAVLNCARERISGTSGSVSYVLSVPGSVCF